MRWTKGYECVRKYMIVTRRHYFGIKTLANITHEYMFTSSYCLPWGHLVQMTRFG